MRHWKETRRYTGRRYGKTHGDIVRRDVDSIGNIAVAIILVVNSGNTI